MQVPIVLYDTLFNLEYFKHVTLFRYTQIGRKLFANDVWSLGFKLTQVNYFSKEQYAARIEF